MKMSAAKHISSFHYLTQYMPSCSHAELADKACRGGVEWVQLRVKNVPLDAWKKIAEEVKNVCNKYNAKLIINDHVLLATEVKADGVHLGKEDMAVKKARKILGAKAIIGGTANTAEDILRLQDEGADYVGLGPLRFSSTKEKLSPLLGIDGIKKIMKSLEGKLLIPVIAIGGVGITDVERFKQSGIRGIAVSSSVNFAAEPTYAVKAFLKKIQTENCF